MSLEIKDETVDTIEDLVERLGNVSLRRIVLKPPPGRATEQDLLRLMRRTGRLYELVEGTLVEKVMGYLEGSLAAWLIYLIQDYLVTNDLGNLAGADGTMRLMPRLVRIPDVSFVRWDKLPGRTLPVEPTPDLAPDLAIEILSEGNTPGEMARKRKEYFFCGTLQVWLVDPQKRLVLVYVSPDEGVAHSEADTLDGGSVLPGFTLPVKRIFERLPAGTPRKPRTPRKKRS